MADDGKNHTMISCPTKGCDPTLSVFLVKDGVAHLVIHNIKIEEGLLWALTYNEMVMFQEPMSLQN